MPERIIVGDEEPGVAAALHYLLGGADRERAGIDHPLDGVRRAELAVEIRGQRRMRDEKLLLFGGDILYREPDRGDRHVHDQIDLFGIIPSPRDRSADIRFELMVADDDADRLAQ